MAFTSVMRSKMSRWKSNSYLFGSVEADITTKKQCLIIEEMMWFYLSFEKIPDGQVEEFPSNWKPCVILLAWITEQTDQGFVHS